MNRHLKVTKTLDSKHYLLSGKCSQCAKIQSIKVTTHEYYSWFTKGDLIQVAMPNLTPSDREFLTSGICGECFDSMFGEE